MKLALELLYREEGILQDKIYNSEDNNDIYLEELRKVYVAILELTPLVK